MSAEEPIANPSDAAAADAPAAAPAPRSGKVATSARVSAKPRSSSAAQSSKKAPATPNDNKSFKVGDVVLARLKGYPPWPARIADPEDVPKAVAAQRPSKSTSTYCVNYFPAGDFSWLPARDINALSRSDITAFLNGSHRKASGALREAYETAKDPSAWLSEQQEALKQREEEERAAEEDVDQLEEEEATGGKRKRSSKADAKASKKTKSGKKGEEEAAPKGKAAKAKKATAPASAPENQAAADDDPLASDPECVKVKDWRHKLQRAFLGKGLPSANEMDTYNDIFNTIENYKDITIEALQYSKIGKVMKKIATLEGIPRNDELKITERAAKLMNEWADFINSAGGDKTNGAKEEGADAEANGSADASKSDKKEEAPVAAPAEEAKSEKKPAEDESAPAAATESTEEKKEEPAAEANGKEEEKMDVEA